MLTLLVTLYYDKKSGQYQEKNGTIVLREFLETSKNNQIHKGIGLCKINLTEKLSDIFNCDDNSAGKNICFSLDNKPNCFINASINAKYCNIDDDDDDDDQSILSTYSGQSIMCADFDFNANISSLLSISEESQEEIKEESKEDFFCYNNNKALTTDEIIEDRILKELNIEDPIIDSRSSPIDQLQTKSTIISPSKSPASTKKYDSPNNSSSNSSHINSPNNIMKSPIRSLATEYLLERYPLSSRNLTEKGTEQ
jgi:hypothetical protein